MSVFGALRVIREFERAELPFLRSIEDLDIVREIGFHHEAGQPLTPKQLYALGIGAVATVQRRLTQLKKLGVIEQVRVERDRRTSLLLLSPGVLQAYARYLALWTKLSRKRARAQLGKPE